jgi:putative heme-binding domain-containing protein
MYGALFVVEDLDAYEANPEAYLAAANLPVKDDLLKDRRPRTEWRFDDLAEGVGHLVGGRSFANARQMFTVASCVACHKLDGTGNQFGPDLAQLDAKLQPADILKELLDPSAKINEKFQTQVFQLESGQSITGLVVEETPELVKLVENPLAKTAIVEIKTSTIAARKKSPTSIMPKGLLDKLTRDEILDLVAFLHARGNKDHAVFQAGSGHGGHKH